MADDDISPLWCVRDLPRTPEIRATEDGPSTLFGHFSAVGDWYEIDSLFEGNFLERTAPGFPVITNRTQILFNHGFDPEIGDKVIAAIRSVDPATTRYEGDLFTLPQIIVDGLRAGVYGSSFRFQVQEDSWNNDPGRSDYNPKGLPERTITRANVPEFGPVTFPANPGADSGARSGTDRFYEQLLRSQPEKFSELVERAHSLRSPSGRADTRSAAGGQQGGESPTSRDVHRNNRWRLIQEGVL